jgi:hypothetical protein
MLSTELPAEAAPVAFSVNPRIAPTASAISVVGGGCAGAVQITMTGYLFPGPPSVPVDQSVQPDAGGNWSVDLEMPATPAYVVATCDGVSTQPIVIAPNDVAGGGLVPTEITDTHVVLTTSPLVDDSEMAVFDPSGSLVAAGTAVDGVASVSISRAVGPVELIVLALRAQDPFIPLPFVPIALRVQMPLAAPPMLVVEPHVTTAGAPVTIGGTCAGAPSLVVKGRPLGWYDPPPVFATVTNLPSNSSFSTTLPMPVIPSTIDLACTSGNVTETRTELVSPAFGDLVPLTATIDGSGYLVAVPGAVTTPPLAAYTTTGTTVPLSLVPAPFTVRVQPSAGVDRVIILGIEALGENAVALQNSRVQAWSVDLLAAVSPTTSTTATTIATVPSATQPPATPPPGPVPPVSTTPPPTTVVPSLPATGRHPASTAATATLCLAAGLTMVALVRRRRCR